MKEAVLGSLSFNGQRCTALKIFFVHKSVVDLFTKRLSEEIAKLKFGMPWVKDVALTPLPEPNKPAYLKECIDDAIANGAKVMNENGGTTLESFVYPAVLYPVTSQMKIYREEQFGPVIPIVPFNDLEEPIQYLINADHGQQVSIFSSNADEIASLVDPLVNQVSRVNINVQCQRGPDTFPFTGRKDSAEGTLSVTAALRAFSIRSMIATKVPDANKKLLNDVRGLRAFITKNPEQMQYLEAMTQLFQTVAKDKPLEFKTEPKKRALVLMFLSPDLNRHDSHNIPKAFCDWLQQVKIIANDRHVDAFARRKTDHGITGQSTDIMLVRYPEANKSVDGMMSQMINIIRSIEMKSGDIPPAQFTMASQHKSSVV